MYDVEGALASQYGMVWATRIYVGWGFSLYVDAPSFASMSIISLP